MASPPKTMLQILRDNPSLIISDLRIQSSKIHDSNSLKSYKNAKNLRAKNDVTSNNLVIAEFALAVAYLQYESAQGNPTLRLSDKRLTQQNYARNFALWFLSLHNALDVRSDIFSRLLNVGSFERRTPNKLEIRTQNPPGVQEIPYTSTDNPGGNSFLISAKTIWNTLDEDIRTVYRPLFLDAQFDASGEFTDLGTIPVPSVHLAAALLPAIEGEPEEIRNLRVLVRKIKRNEDPLAHARLAYKPPTPTERNAAIAAVQAAAVGGGGAQQILPYPQRLVSKSSEPLIAAADNSRSCAAAIDKLVAHKQGMSLSEAAATNFKTISGFMASASRTLKNLTQKAIDACKRRTRKNPRVATSSAGVAPLPLALPSLAASSAVPSLAASSAGVAPLPLALPSLAASSAGGASSSAVPSLAASSAGGASSSAVPSLAASSAAAQPAGASSQAVSGLKRGRGGMAPAPAASNNSGQRSPSKAKRSRTNKKSKHNKHNHHSNNTAWS